jgi:nitrate/TMAO reductase-like tetraheme cytochrome c subunit
MKSTPLVVSVILVLGLATAAGIWLGRSADDKPLETVPPAQAAKPDYLRAVYSPLHFRPAIESATDAQCLECHREVLDDRVRESSPAGVKAQAVKAWYQLLDTYEGDQETLHRRHLVTPFARQVMKLNCNTCHQGHDPREEAPVPPIPGDAGYTLRKQVDPAATCLKCHGQMAWQIMGLPGPWHESGENFANNCLTCHSAIRSKRHQVSYLDAAAIEKAAQEKGGDVCYGCHGGRAWYRIPYPYPRHAWDGMAPDTPDWAKDRPTESEARFLIRAAAPARP